MVITRVVAMRLWNDIFGENTIWARDCFGTWIHKDDFGNTTNMRRRPNGDGKEYVYGWTVDHIMPISKGGKDTWNNFEPMHYINNNKKGGDISFKIENVSYQVIKCNLCPGYGYGIKNQQTNQRIDWKGVQQRWYI
ncbi:MAG: HNH endonuclease [Firmicutes bacterium]|nr:HNH endonuclease [Bacillota bacterium]